MNNPENDSIPGRPVESVQQPSQYRSLFESINYDDAAESIPYNGTLGGVLDDLSRVVREPGQPDKTLLILHPPRIIRAAIDYKVEHPDSQVAHALVRESIKLGLQIYKDADQSAKLLDQFRHTVADGAEELLTLPLVQKKDVTTWEASHHDKSQRTAEELAEGNNDILFIALAHGGVAAGMDTFLRYCDMKKDSDSAFYVVRLSHSSTYDTDAKITKSEEAYLQELSKGRSVVVFDEDQATGQTLENAELSVQKVVHKPVSGIANMGAPAGYFSD